jgi:hypothetical protein
MNFVALILLLPFLSWGMDHEHISLSKQLEKYTTTMNGQTHVLYGKWKKEGAAELSQYLRGLSAVTKKEYDSFNSDQKLAFLINSYNSFTVKLILDHYPVKSIKDTGTLITSPWKKKFFTLFGEDFHLDRIEHDMIRKDFKEPRIHFAVNCASIGCPSLLRKSFSTKNLEQDLAKAEAEFFKNPMKFRTKGNAFEVSKILDWYGDDFRKTYASLETFLALKAREYGASPEIDPKKVRVTFMDYDWNLNGE